MGVVSFMRRTARTLGVAAAVVLLAGCAGAGASTAPSAAPTGAAPTGAATTGAATTGAATVDVTLQEWAIVPATTSLAAGKVTFNAKNAGPTDEHEMVVLKTDLPLLGLPTGADGKVDEEAAGLTSMGEVSELGVGATGSVTVDLAAGRYLLICNVVDADGDAHYGKGMVTEITVK